MKRFFKKIFIFFSIIFILLTVLLLIDNIIATIFKDEILDRKLYSKITSIYKESEDGQIIIGGDSRAAEQLIPSIIQLTTNLETYNLARGSCDLVTFLSLINKFNLTESNNIFVISISSWQINDGSIEPGYLSNNIFQNLTFFEKIKLFSYDLKKILKQYKILYRRYMKIVKYNYFSKDNNDLNNNKFDKKGFIGIDKNLDINENIMEGLLLRHPWYKKPKTEGFRYKLFEQSLIELNNLRNGKIIIYQPPVSPSFKNYIEKNNEIAHYIELDYSNKIKNIINKYNLNNLVFFDFYNNPISDLNDIHFYDIQHLNISGAEIFTKFISKAILDKFINI